MDIDKVYHLLPICGHRYYRSIKYVYDKMYMRMVSRVITSIDGNTCGNYDWYNRTEIRYYTYGSVAIPLTSQYTYSNILMYCDNYIFEYDRYDLYYLDSRIEYYNKENIQKIRKNGYRISYLFCTDRYTFRDLDESIFCHIISFLDIIYLHHIRNTCKWTYSLYNERMSHKSYHTTHDEKRYIQVENAFHMLGNSNEYDEIENLHNIEHYIQYPLHH